MLTQSPFFLPSLGSEFAAVNLPARARWVVQNTGSCPWRAARFVFSPVARQAVPPGVPGLEQGTQSLSGSAVVPGQFANVILVLAGTTVLMQPLDWTWKVQIEAPDGSWLDVQAGLTLKTASPWLVPVTPALTATPIPVPALQPPVLLEPKPALSQQTYEGEETFIGYDAAITFKWSPPNRPLQPDEYYVLVITHRRGVEYRWAGKQPTYSPPPTQEGLLGWLIDQVDTGGRLRWRVLVVRTGHPKQTGAPDPQDQIVVQSAEGSFRWVKSGQG